jgi:hypothetical protein
VALPPDPIDDVVTAAYACVDAQVIAVLYTDPDAHERGQFPQQSVRVRVDAVGFGDVVRDADGALTLTKPHGPYLLRVGDRGPLLLGRAAGDLHDVILGRYGPDTYSVAALRASCARLSRPFALVG